MYASESTERLKSTEISPDRATEYQPSDRNRPYSVPTALPSINRATEINRSQSAPAAAAAPARLPPLRGLRHFARLRLARWRRSARWRPCCRSTITTASPPISRATEINRSQSAPAAAAAPTRLSPRAGGRVAAPPTSPHHRQSIAEPLSTAARSRPLGALCFGRAPRAFRRSSPPPFGPPPLRALVAARWRRPCPRPRNKQQRIFLSTPYALSAPPSRAPLRKRGRGAGRCVRSGRYHRSTADDRPFLLLSSVGSCAVGAWGGQSPRASSPPPAHLGRR